MRVMLLAAGRGERLRPLTDRVPKPLLPVGGLPLIDHHLIALVQSGWQEVIINLSYLGQQIADHVGDGSRYGIQVVYSHEGDNALETGGGIRHALSWLGQEPFAVINADIWTDYPRRLLHRTIPGSAHLILVDNPPHHQEGDFALSHGHVESQGDTKLTFSGIGFYHPDLFLNAPAGPFPLGQWLRHTIEQHHTVTGEHYSGIWFDAGTPERLHEVDTFLLHTYTMPLPLQSPPG